MSLRPQEVLADLAGSSLRRGIVQTPFGDLQIEQVVETHSARVLLTEDLAFKIRKPVDLGFLNYRTRDARRSASKRELQIGYRISPQIYRGLFFLGEDGRLVSEPTGGGREPVLVMERLPEALRADLVFAKEESGKALIDGVVADCIRFHRRCLADREPTSYGAPVHLGEAVAACFAGCSGESPFSDEERDHLLLGSLAYLKAAEPLLVERIRAGRVRKGHGDLRLEHIYLTSPWSVIDPLEFSKALRICDVAAEVAFLAMELDELGREDLSMYFLTRYSQLTRDETLLVVAPFFKRYRALVRARVTFIRANQLKGEEATYHYKRARRFVELALSYQLRGGS